MTDDEYSKILKKFHKHSGRHILVAEAVMKVVGLSDKIRKAENELVGSMRIKRYRK